MAHIGIQKSLPEIRVNGESIDVQCDQDRVKSRLKRQLARDEQYASNDAHKQLELLASLDSQVRSRNKSLSSLRPKKRINTGRIPPTLSGRSLACFLRLHYLYTVAHKAAFTSELCQLNSSLDGVCRGCRVMEMDGEVLNHFLTCSVPMTQSHYIHAFLRRTL
jgi:hypothetical protein